MRFDESTLSPPLRTALGRLGFTDATPVQEACLAAVMDRRSVIALAPTGSGKTLAFGLGILENLLRRKPRRHGRHSDRIHPRERLRALVLAPTRELAQQVARDLAAVTKGSVLRVGEVHGKSPMEPQRRMLDDGIDLLVATPGRALEFLAERPELFGTVEVAVIDEADRMVDMGFLPQVEKVLEACPGAAQRVAVSATLPKPVEERLRGIAPEAEIITVGERNAAAPGEHTHYEVEDGAKVALLLALVKAHGLRGAAVYTRTRRRAGWVAEALRRHGIEVALVHGDRSQRRRDEAIAAFAAGRAGVLVATDVAARGLHIAALRTVVNYDIPILPEEFVHRVGRSGHGSGRSNSISFVCPADKARFASACAHAGLSTVAHAMPDVRAFELRGRPAPDEERPRREQPRKSAAPQAVRQGTAQRAPDRKAKPPSRRHGGGRVAQREGDQLRGSARRAPIAPGQRPGGGVRRPST